MIRILRWSIFSIFIVFLLITFYGKISFSNLDYNSYLKSAIYSLEDDYSSYFPEMKTFLLDDESITSFEDLMNKSESVLIIDVVDEPFINGKALINKCKVNKIIKGENFQLGSNILIYDLLLNIDKNSLTYFGGMTPLKIGNKYIVFIRKTENASVKNSYVFNSAKYGHFNLTDESSVLENYKNYSLHINDVTSYDYIFQKEKTGIHESIKKDILSYLEKN